MALNISNSKKILMALSQASNAFITYKGRLKVVVEVILNQAVFIGMQTKYENHNADLILWIYKKDEWSEALLRDWMVERLITAEDEGKKAMRATCKYALNSTSINDDNFFYSSGRDDIQSILSLHVNKKSEKPGVYLYATSSGGICSAITHMFSVSGMDMYQVFKK